MRRLPLVILVIVALVAVVMGCSRAPRYDSRLVAADSLMHDAPDSALAIIDAVSLDSLATEADHAYRDLLITQARYKCYIVATTDSDINRALNYYRRHDNEREKLTRAYIYKGAVMEELGHPDSAMLYYKQAEANAAPNDYFNLGYVNLRMGNLYANYFAYDGLEIEKYEEAISHFTKIGNQEYLHKCKNNLGCLYRESDPVKAEQLLNQAKEISLLRNDTACLIDDIHALVVLYYYNKRYNQALKLVHDLEQLRWPKEKLSFDFCTTAANVYAKVGQPDSAMAYLKLAEQYYYKNNPENEIYFLESLEEIALAKGDTITYLKLNNHENKLSNSLIANDTKVKITKSEKAFEKTNHESTTRLISIMKWLLIISIVIAVFTILFSILKSQKMNCRSKKLSQLIKQLEEDSSNQLSHLNQLHQDYEILQNKEMHTREFIDSQIDVLRQISVACYHKPNNTLGNQIKGIIEYHKNNHNNWTKLYDYIDAKFNNIVSKTRTRYPQLNDKDLLLISLCCMEFSYIQIAIILGYSNASSIGTIKMRLAEKMGLKHSLNDYIIQMKES